MRAFDRDLIRGRHYGQRSCEPHLQAEHMAAPTNAAKREESPCQPGAVHTWHISEVLLGSFDFLFRGCPRTLPSIIRAARCKLPFPEARCHYRCPQWVQKLTSRECR